MLNCVPFVLTVLPFLLGNGGPCDAATGGFVGTNGVHFVVNGQKLYLNGFNAYWMIVQAADPSWRGNVTAAFRQASAVGMNVARIWGFNDGNFLPLQTSPGTYNEQVFQGLDFVVGEARKSNIKLILSLVNNYEDFGGRQKYVQWANLTDPDEFYTHPLVKQFYMNHLKTMAMRKNRVTGLTYKDDPTIFAWELINEPRCNDPSGSKLQNWLKQMANYAKSIDANHMIGIGLEGFYGDSKPERKIYNPNNVIIGTDFLSNHQIPKIDFATIHIYPENWLPPQNSSESQQIAFVDKWITSHIQDCDTILKKPLVIGEFGKSSKALGFNLSKRNMYFQRVYDSIYASARAGSSAAGGIFWQLTTIGTKNMGDGYEVVLDESRSTGQVIAAQSRRLSKLSHMPVIG